MNYSVNVTYNRPLVRRALNRFMFDRMGWTLMAGLPGVSLLLVILFFLDAWNIWLSVVAVALAVTIGAIFYIYFLRLKTSEGFFEKAKSPSVKLKFTSDGVTTESDLGSSDLKWAAFDELLKFPDVWLLIYARSGYLTIPTNVLTAECKEFIEERLTSRKAV